MAKSEIGMPSAGKVAKVKTPTMKTQKAPTMDSSMSGYNTASKASGMKSAISKYADKMNVF